VEHGLGEMDMTSIILPLQNCPAPALYITQTCKNRP